MQVRWATPFDIPWIAAQLRVFAGSLGTKHPYVPEKETDLYDRLLAIIDKHVLLISETDGIKTGVIGGVFYPHPFNSALKTLSMWFWWVPEGYRGTGAGKRLLEAFIESGYEADSISVGVMDRGFVSKESMERLGFKIGEHRYIMEN